MSGVNIRRRTISTGEERFDVRFRRGGRYFPNEHGGTFKTREEADLRADAIRRLLAKTVASHATAIANLFKPERVYFARLGDLIKIGISKDPARRARSFNAVLVGTMDGDREIESALHREFADLRVRGEWFRAEPRLLSRIGELA